MPTNAAAQDNPTTAGAGLDHAYFCMAQPGES